MTIPDNIIKEIHEEWYFVWENMKIRIDMYCG